MLQPELFDVQVNQARYLYIIEKDYQKALQIYEELAIKYPQKVFIKALLGNTHRRLGNFALAKQYYAEVVLLEPTKAGVRYSYGQTLARLRKYKEAEKAFMKVIEMRPDNPDAYQELAEVQIDIDGDTKRARKTLNHPFLQKEMDTRAEIELRDRNFKRAIELWQSVPEEGLVGQAHFVPKSLGLALVYYMAGNDSAQVLFRESIDPILSKVEETPEDKRLYASLGLAYAGLDERQKAMESVERLDGFRNRTPDALEIPVIEHEMIRIYIMLKEFNPAMELVIKHLDGPTGTNWFSSCTINDLKLHPMYDPLRELPEFQAILENPKYQINLQED
jgi:predicted Zn-dependent protease